jgi:hypothetical protein
MRNIIKSHWRGDDGFWQTCLLNVVVGILLAFIASCLLVVVGALVAQAFPSSLKIIIPILCAVIPFIAYSVWLNVGVFRYGLRVLRDKKGTTLQKAGGVTAILLMVYYVIQLAVGVCYMISSLRTRME